MRTLPRLLVLTAATALVATPLTAAHAADRTYRVSVSVGPKLVDVSSQTKSARRTKISGKVTGGSVSGRRVHLVATNTSDGDRERSLGSVGLSSSGKFSKTWYPPVGGEWRVRATIDGTDTTAGDSGSAMLDAFHWTYLYELDTPDNARLLLGDDTKTERVRKKWFGESEYVIHGGTTVTWDTRGYQCKKINFKIGVADSSHTKKGSYKVHQPSGTNGTHTIKNGTMRRGQKAYDAFKHKKVRDRMRPSRTLQVKIGGTSSLKYVLGNAKIFCTFPSAND